MHVLQIIRWLFIYYVEYFFERLVNLRATITYLYIENLQKRNNLLEYLLS